MQSNKNRLSGWAVFDLDGTLADTLTDISRALGSVLQKHGRPSLSLVETKSLIGKGPKTLMERAWISTGQPASHDELPSLTEEYLHAYRFNPKGGAQPFPGIQEGLRSLVRLGWRLGLCTNKDGLAARSLVEELGWGGWIKVVVSGEETVRKPDPRPLQLALRRMQAPSGHHLFVGDSEVDLQTARNACVEGVFLGHGYGEFGTMSHDGMRFFSNAVDMFSWMARSGPKGKNTPNPLVGPTCRFAKPGWIS